MGCYELCRPCVYMVVAASMWGSDSMAGTVSGYKPFIRSIVLGTALQHPLPRFPEADKLATTKHNFRTEL